MTRASGQLAIALRDSSAVGEARRAISRLATESGFDETQAGKVAIVATELATNVLKHGGGGEIIAQPVSTIRGPALELLALDRGPGMADPERCLGDGFSTAGTAGNGLGAVRRLSIEFDLHSAPGLGTTVLSRVAKVHDPQPKYVRESIAYGGLSRPVDGEIDCGDGWRVVIDASGFSACVVDGLGHGTAAKAATDACLSSFDEDPARDPVDQLERAHRRMAGTRGGAAAVARLEFESGTLRYAGVGNIAGSLVANGVGRGLVSHNGTLGLQFRRIQAFEHRFEAGSLLVMHSDGLQSRWSLDRYPGLAKRHPALVAAVLYRDFTRGRDDVTVIAASARGS